MQTATSREPAERNVRRFVRLDGKKYEQVTVDRYARIFFGGWTTSIYQRWSKDFSQSYPCAGWADDDIPSGAMTFNEARLERYGEPDSLKNCYIGRVLSVYGREIVYVLQLGDERLQRSFSTREDAEKFAYRVDGTVREKKLYRHVYEYNGRYGEPSTNETKWRESEKTSWEDLPHPFDSCGHRLLKTESQAIFVVSYMAREWVHVDDFSDTSRYITVAVPI